MATTSNDPAFAMHGARAAVAGGMFYIEEKVKALELAVIENSGLAFDLAKTLVESTCKTIITERGGSFSTDDDLPRLFRAAGRIVPFLPLGNAGDVASRRSLERTLNGLNTALQGVCELRNSCGFASHGSESPRPAMEAIQALLVAQAADAIIGFLYSAHIQDLSRPKALRLEYDDNAEFNEWLDEQCEPVVILALPPYGASEVLFRVDEEAYRELLNEYKAEKETQGQTDEQGGGTVQ